jgi:hypothetical protein
MPLPSSGPLGINAIRNELGTSNGSLRYLSSLAGFGTPDAISEFYGYSSATVPYSYGGPRILFDFASTANYGNGIVTIPDLSGNGNPGTFTVGTLGGSATGASGYVNSGLSSGYEFQTSPEYSIQSNQTRNIMQLMAGSASYTIVIWYYHRSWQTNYPGIDTFSSNFEWIITPDISGYRMWHQRGFNYAFINFSSLGQTYNLNQWHFVVIRYNRPTYEVSIDWYNNSGTRITSTAYSYGQHSGGVLQVPLRYNNFLHGRVGYYAVNNYDIGAGGSDTIFAATRGRYGR